MLNLMGRIGLPFSDLDVFFLIMKYLHFLMAFAVLISFCSCGGGDDEPVVGSDITEAISIPADGGQFTVDVKIKGSWVSSVDYGFNASSDNWLTVTPGTGEGGSIKLDAKPNTAYDPRHTQVTVRAGKTYQFIDVTQEPAQKPINESLSFANAGGQVEVPVKLSGNWTAQLKSDFCSLIAASGNGGSVKLQMDRNDQLSARIGKLEIRCGTSVQNVELVQSGDVSQMDVCPMGEEYQLVWSDGFDTDGGLSSDWRYEVQGSGWVNHELQNYVRQKSPAGQEVTTVQSGILSINCFKENDKIYSARIYAKDNVGWTYGYIEASINLPSGKGTWPAFWMMPVNFRSWPHDGEIDIMEEVGYHRDYVSSSLHADGHVHSNNTQVTHEMYCKGAEGEFHVYGMEWTEDYIQTYVDGKKQLYYANDGQGDRNWPYHTPFYVILNLAWGGDWGGSQGVNEAALPVSMKVDYVRVFQKK